VIEVMEVIITAARVFEVVVGSQIASQWAGVGWPFSAVQMEGN
jgi:hypothetical protein